MSQSIALFGLKVKPGDIHRIPMVFRDFRITNVSLGENVVGDKRVVVKVHHIPHYGHPAVEEEDAAEDSDEDDEEESDEDNEADSEDEDIKDALKAEKSYTERSFVLCTLYPGRQEQATVDIAFTEDEDIGFSVVGDNEVDLLGNYTAPVGADQPPYSDEEDDSDMYDSEIDSDEAGDSYDNSDFDEDEDEYDSDEIDMDGLEAILAEGDSGEEDEDEDEESDESKIEELEDAIAESKPSQKKRKAAEQDVEVEDVSMTAPVTDSELAEIAAAEGLDATKLSKSQRKRLNKKLKSATDAADASVASTASAPVTKKETVKAAVAEGSKAKTAAKETTQKDGKQVSQKTKLPSGLTIEIKKEGSGPGAKKGAKIGMRYIGKLASNGKVFDSNTKGKPFSFKLGRGEVIKAWDEGVAGMKVGEERRLTCPPSTAYGSRGAPPDIPGNSTLVFDIKCVSI